MPWNAGASSDSERVREASDIVTVVGRYVSLQARGREFVGLCPFHDDRKPSMTVSPAKQIFKCFSCGQGGDVYSFVQQYHGLEFRGALEMLAQEAGIELTRRNDRASSNDDRSGPSRRDLLEANNHACGFFQALLDHPEHGRSAREIIEHRQISSDMVEQFRIGTSPDRYDGLLMTVDKRRWSLPSFAGAGLVKSRETGGHYDAFRNRLIFPIADQAGNIIAFGGRRLNDEDNPKYLNSPESSLFSKGKHLYGLFQATRAIKQTGRAVVVEGYTDVIACHQHGFRNVVATLGTALTPDHARVLRRLCREVVLLFDGDAAGLKAAERAVEVFFTESLDVRIATLASVTDAKDPDETLALPDGETLFRDAIDMGEDLLGFLFRGVKAEMESSGPAARARIVQDFVERLARLGLDNVPPMQRSLINRRLAELTGTDWNTVQSVLSAARPTRGPRREADQQTEQSFEQGQSRSRALNAREELLGCLLTDGSLADHLGAREHLHSPAALDAILDPSAYGDPVLAELADAVKSMHERKGAITLHAVLDELSSRESDHDETDTRTQLIRRARNAAVRLSEQASKGVDDDRDALVKKVDDCVRRLRWQQPDTPQKIQGADESEPSGAEVSVMAKFQALQAKHRELGKNPTGMPRVDRP